jgi:hypothetical protein
LMLKNFSRDTKSLITRKKALQKFISQQLSNHPLLLNPIYGLNQTALLLPILRAPRAKKRRKIDVPAYKISPKIRELLSVSADPHFGSLEAQLSQMRRMKNGDIAVTRHACL